MFSLHAQQEGIITLFPKMKLYRKSFVSNSALCVLQRSTKPVDFGFITKAGHKLVMLFDYAELSA